MNFLGLVLRSLFRSRRRTVVAVLSLAVSVFLVALLQSLLLTLEGLSQSTPASGSRFLVQDRASYTNPISSACASFLRQQPEIEDFSGFLWFGGEYRDPRQFFANFAVDLPAYIRIYREECRLERIPAVRIRELLADGNGCMIGQALADKFGWRLGDTVPLVSPIYALPVRLTIRCIYDGPRKSDEMHLVFPIRQVQEAVASMQGRVGFFVVRARRAEDVPMLCERIERNFANSAQEIACVSENAFNLDQARALAQYAAMMRAISAAVMLAILIVAGSTMATSIRERGAEIATLRSLGFRTGRVLRLLLAEGLLLALLGAALGTLLATGMAGLAARMVGDILPWMGDFRILPGTLLGCAAGTLVLGALSTLMPAYRASRLDITEGLRSLG